MFTKKVSLLIAVIYLIAIFGAGFGVATLQKSNQKSQETANALQPDTQTLESVRTRSEKPNHLTPSKTLSPQRIQMIQRSAIQK